MPTTCKLLTIEYIKLRFCQHYDGMFTETDTDNIAAIVEIAVEWNKFFRIYPISKVEGDFSKGIEVWPIDEWVKIKTVELNREKRIIGCNAAEEKKMFCIALSRAMHRKNNAITEDDAFKLVETLLDSGASKEMILGATGIKEWEI